MNYESVTDKEVNKRIKELVRKKKEKHGGRFKKQ